MNYEIVELEELSGPAATIYGVLPDGDDFTSFDHFVQDNMKHHRSEIKFIVDRLKQIGKKFGARESFFKVNEGLPGDGVCALYDEPESKLRLYCIRYGNVAIILGGGGLKSPGVLAWQDDEKLAQEAGEIINVSKAIMERLRDDQIKWSHDGSQLTGNLIFKYEGE